MSDDFGQADYQFWNPDSIVAFSSLSGDVAFQLSGGLTAWWGTDQICTFDNTGDRGIAWGSQHFFSSYVTIHAIYINSTQDGIESSGATILPVGTTGLYGIRKTGKYTFRVLVILNLTNIAFYDVDVNAGTYALISSYAISSEEHLSANTRSGDIIYGLKVTYGTYNVQVFGLTANLLDATYSISGLVWDGGGDSANIVDVDYGISAPQLQGFWHDGNTGCNIKIAASIGHYDFPVDRWRLHIADAMVVTIYGTSFSVNVETDSTTVNQNLNIGETPSRSRFSAGGNFYSNERNSFYNGIIAGGGGAYPIQYSGYPYTLDTAALPDVQGHIVTETGTQLQNYTYRKQAASPILHLTNMQGFTDDTAFSNPSGYTGYSFCNRIDSQTGNVFVFGKRNSDSYYGLLEYGQNGSFIRFIPIIATPASTAVFEVRISENFIMQTTATFGTDDVVAVYYIKNTHYAPTQIPNVLMMIFEQN